uniref:Uncharacterized protein n=1 Tax=Marinobacter nauticus TaxID=2743 RepID=A0A455W7T0_MARNT|nr:hypothetical protein YBY_30200 [Marinobacter nauticus]
MSEGNDAEPSLESLGQEILDLQNRLWAAESEAYVARFIADSVLLHLHQEKVINGHILLGAMQKAAEQMHEGVISHENRKAVLSAVGELQELIRGAALAGPGLKH